MKKLFILAGIVAIFTPSQTILAAARHQAQAVRPQPHGGILRVLFGCCCATGTADGAIIALEVVHTGLEIMLTANPGAVREIYLLCQRAGYALSDFTVELLQTNGFLDDHGNFKVGWRTHVKQLLTHNGSAEGAEGFHFVQSIQDLIAKHPQIVSELEGAVAGRNAYIDATARILNEQYGFTKSPAIITDDELAKIVAGIKRETTTVRAHHKEAPHFRIMDLDEAAAGRDTGIFF